MTYVQGQGRPSVGILPSADATQIVDVAAVMPEAPRSLAEIFADADLLERLKPIAADPPPGALRPTDGLRYLPVVPKPGKIVCMGLNYADHAKEGGNARPDYPAIFLRGATSLIGHGEPIRRPRVSTFLDFEAELAVVVGRRARRLDRRNALDCIAGYACFNDATLRDFQRKSSQWTIGKNFDGTGAFGPCLVTPDELPRGCNGLRIRSRLNGQVMQDANTRDFLWNIEETLVLITECMTSSPATSSLPERLPAWAMRGIRRSGCNPAIASRSTSKASERLPTLSKTNRARYKSREARRNTPHNRVEA